MVKSIFEADPNHTEMSKGKLSFISVGSKFRKQLTQLMEKLRSTVSIQKTQTNYLLSTSIKIKYKLKRNLKKTNLYCIFEGTQIKV